ncbi:MAG: winged helix-turn-helix transcriptional regulator [Chloroflexi bacterium]|nr:winged helix-turn-helix transcriptional regulator [Chloroflexota bacterium]
MVTTVYEALAEPTRRRILDLLRDQPRLVGELVTLLDMSQPGVSKHLRVLREVGLVSVRQDAQRHWYELRTEPLEEIDGWLETYRHLWNERLDRLDRYLIELQARPDDLPDA